MKQSDSRAHLLHRVLHSLLHSFLDCLHHREESINFYPRLAGLRMIRQCKAVCSSLHPCPLCMQHNAGCAGTQTFTVQRQSIVEHHITWRLTQQKVLQEDMAGRSGP